jgi:hypothetical protein
MKNLTLQYWRLGMTNIQIRNPSLAQRHKNRVSLFQHEFDAMETSVQLHG